VADFPASAVAGSTPLDVLILEHSQKGFELLVQALEEAHLKVNAAHVRSRDEFRNRISLNNYDVILSDYHLGDWLGTEALQLLKEQGKDTPLILLSDGLGEEAAVQCIKDGADDFVLKTRMSVLPQAVCRAISDKSMRDTHKRAEASLKETEARFRLLADSIASAVLIYQGTTCRYANRAAQSLTGYSEAELLALSSWDLIHPDSRHLVIERGLSRMRDAVGPTRYEAKILSRLGEVRVWDATIERIEIGGEGAGLLTALDITDRQQSDGNAEHGGYRDSLTGLYSNGQALTIFIGEAKRSQRTGRSFAILLLKVDEWNQIKERSGRAAGSRLLCEIARMVGGVCRSGDSASRFSDDEFLLILPETSLSGARRLMQRISERLNAESSGVPLAISTGAAVFPQDGPTMDHTLRSARRGLKSIRTSSFAKELARSA
jgi:diguanylate cyclase (GGDEF)-like protein/PAS domain S-box-containing protein